jgi:hypothetical protein
MMITGGRAQIESLTSSPMINIALVFDYALAIQG